MKYVPHSKAWYEKLASIQHGYSYPWTSSLPPYNGEQLFLDMVKRSLAPHQTVLDAGCGHGTLALQFAAYCRHIEGYDFVAAYITLAEETRRQEGISNAHLTCYDSSSKTGSSRLPYADNTFDLIISRRGPTSFFRDIRRVAKDGARILQLNPATAPFPAWKHLLPADLVIPGSDAGDFSIQETITHRLQEAHLTCDAFWCIDVPETFSTPEDLYTYLTWSYLDEPAYTYKELESTLHRIFADYAIDGQIAVRQRRFLWTSVIRK